MADIEYTTVIEIGVLSEGSKGWRKELNLISWNNGTLSMTSETGHRITHRWEKVLP